MSKIPIILKSTESAACDEARNDGDFTFLFV